MIEDSEESRKAAAEFQPIRTPRDVYRMIWADATIQQLQNEIKAYQAYTQRHNPSNMTTLGNLRDVDRLDVLRELLREKGGS